MTVQAGASAYQLMIQQGEALAFATVAGKIDEATAKNTALEALKLALSRASGQQE